MFPLFFLKFLRVSYSPQHYQSCLCSSESHTIFASVLLYLLLNTFIVRFNFILRFNLIFKFICRSSFEIYFTTMEPTRLTVDRSIRTTQPMIYSISARVFLKELSHLFSRTSQTFHRCRQRDLGGCLTLEDIPDRYLDWIAQMGFEYVYLLGKLSILTAFHQNIMIQQLLYLMIYAVGVWTTGSGGEKAAEVFMEKHFPDVPKSEICRSVMMSIVQIMSFLIISSPFAITSYTIHTDLGGLDAFQVTLNIIKIVVHIY